MNNPVENLQSPHFIIAGAMKSATTTLQEQLARQPGIFMCEPKEPNFFSDDEHYGKGLAWYKALFSHAQPGDLLGEASTHYTKLPTYPDSVKRLRESLPDARFIYVMRHPVDRLVSHYIHEWSMGKIDSSIDEAVHQHREMVAYGQYAMQLKPFFEVYGRNALLPVFFDRLIREPQAELERVCRFIGYGRAPVWVRDLTPANVSGERVRRLPLHDLLVESAPATWFRRNLIPQGWRDFVKERMTMRQRPVLGHAVRAALEAEFDHDLRRLGDWLGIQLSCKNFKQATGTGELNWITSYE